MATVQQIWFSYQAILLRRRGGGISATRSDEALAVINKLNTPSVAVQNAIATFVDSQVLSGNWPLMIELAVYWVTKEENALTTWILDKTHIAKNAPTFTAGVGFVLNGTSQYLETDFIPSVDGVLQDNVIAGGWVENVTNNGALNSALFSILPNNFSLYNTSANTIKFSANGVGNTTASGGATLENDGLYYVHRDDSANHELFINGVQNQTASRASQAPAAFQFHLGRRYNQSDYLNGTIGMFFIAKAIGFNHSNFYTNLLTLKSALLNALGIGGMAIGSTFIIG